MDAESASDEGEWPADDMIAAAENGSSARPGVAAPLSSRHHAAFHLGKNVDIATFRSYFFCCMDTQFLDSFVTVVDSGSIAEAARRLQLTPGAVAQRIRALESEIGASLVVRS